MTGQRRGIDGEGSADIGDGGRVKTRGLLVALAVGLLFVAGGTALSAWTTSSGGDVDVRETTIETETGLELSATVYEPTDASADEPAPGVALIHGYTGTRGTMSSFATELADRGYVAVTVDQPGHGGSDPPAFADGFGGPATLEHVRSLETVDEDRVALAGHSMGGFASLAAAEEQPDGYESIVLIGSTWGPMPGVEGVPEADGEFPRNAAVLFAPYDEYAPSMWGQSVPGDVDESEKLADGFGTEPPVEHRQVYGSVDDGTTRWFTAPPTIHTGMHRSTATVADTLEWIELTVGEPEATDLASTADQTWYRASFGHALALGGGLVVAVGTTALAWRRLDDAGSDSSASSETAGLPRSTRVGHSARPALTSYPLYAVGTVAVPVTRLTHQDLTHGYVLWGLGTVALAAGFVRWRHGGVDRTALERLVPNAGVAGRSLVAAAAGVGALYALATVVDAVPGGSLNAWIVGLKPLSGLRWLSLAVYAPPIMLAAVGLAAGLERALGSRGSTARALVVGVALTCGGLLVFLAVQYVPLFLGYGMPMPDLGPLAITAINATGLLAAATLVAVATTRLTDSPLVGGFAAGLLATWLLVGTGPIPVAF